MHVIIFVYGLLIHCKAVWTCMYIIYMWMCVSLAGSHALTVSLSEASTLGIQCSFVHIFYLHASGGTGSFLIEEQISF